MGEGRGAIDGFIFGENPGAKAPEGTLNPVAGLREIRNAVSCGQTLFLFAQQRTPAAERFVDDGWIGGRTENCFLTESAFERRLNRRLCCESGWQTPRLRPFARGLRLD